MDHAASLSSIRPSIGSLPPLLYRFDARLTVTPIGLVPEGLRMANSFEGKVTQGLLLGARVWGIDHLLLRSDGIAVLDAQKTISFKNTHVHEHVRGYGLLPPGIKLPPLTELLDPGFVWPDVLFPVLGSSTFRAAAEELEPLNRALCRVDGWFSFSTGELGVETRLLHHLDEVGAPRPISANTSTNDAAAPTFATLSPSLRPTTTNIWG